MRGWAVANGCERRWQVLPARTGVKRANDADPGTQIDKRWRGSRHGSARESRRTWPETAKNGQGGNSFRVARRYWPCWRQCHAQAGENPYGPIALKGSPNRAPSLADRLVDRGPAQTDHAGNFGDGLAV